MRDYELTVVFHPDLEMNLDPAVDKVKKIIDAAGGKITNEEDEGKKRLSYTVGGQDFAIFYYFAVALPSEAPKKINSALNIADEVLRVLLVKADPRKAKMDARRAARPAEADAEASEAAGEEVAAAATEAVTEDATKADNITKSEKGE